MNVLDKVDLTYAERKGLEFYLESPKSKIIDRLIKKHPSLFLGWSDKNIVVFKIYCIAGPDNSKDFKRNHHKYDEIIRRMGLDKLCY